MIASVRGEVRPERVNVSSVLASHVHDQRLAGVLSRHHPQGTRIDPGFAQHVGDDPPKQVAADAANHSAAHAHFRQIDRRVCRTTSKR